MLKTGEAVTTTFLDPMKPSRLTESYAKPFDLVELVPDPRTLPTHDSIIDYILLLNLQHLALAHSVTQHNPQDVSQAGSTTYQHIRSVTGAAPTDLPGMHAVWLYDEIERRLRE